MKKLPTKLYVNDYDEHQNDWLVTQAAKFYEGICKLIKWYEKCLDLNGDSIENKEKAVVLRRM